MHCLPSPWCWEEVVRWPPAACLLDLDPHPLLHPAPSRSGRSCLPSCSRQQHVVADNGAVCAGDNRGLLPDLGKWTTVRQSGQCKPHQISRRYPFWCSEICCTGFYFFIFLWMDECRRKISSFWIDHAEHASPPKQDSWCCGSPHGGRTETCMTPSFWWVIKSGLV